MANDEGLPFWRRHVVLLILGAFALLVGVIVLGQVLEAGDIQDWLSDLPATVSYFMVFLLVALDGVIPIFPGETTLSAASTLAAQGDLQLGLVMLAGALGAIVGDSCLFWIARKNSGRIEPTLNKALESPKVSAGWNMLEASPGLLIVAGRYVPGLRFVVNATMGLSDIRYTRFLPWSILGGTLWSVYTCALAYKVATTLSGYPAASMVISGLITTAMLAVIFLVYRRKQAQPEPAQGP
jgi:membrane-associated protein